MSLNERGLGELIDLIDKGDITPLDVANDVVSAVTARDDSVRAYIEFYQEDLVDNARRMSEDGSYRSLPLRGLPIALKDNICVQGKHATAGSRILGGYHSLYDATVTHKLHDAGAIISGKTNLDEFAMGSSTENSAFGPTRNPLRLTHAPGGSSGGSAAAVAADMAIASLGSDTGGSIRQPAAFCGVVGMKPTYGRVSRYGLIAFASSLDQIGPFTKNVHDCALMLNAICGRDPKDATSIGAEVPDFTATLARGADGLRVGIPWDFLEVGMDPEVEANFRDSADKLRAAGAEIVDVSMRHASAACACYYVIANAEASSNLARYDGVKYGIRENNEDVYRMYTETREVGFGDEVKRRILMGTYVLSSGYYDAYYLKAQKVRSLVVRDFSECFASCDAVMMPTSPTTAFELGEKVDDPLTMYLSDIFTIPVNLAGLPGISVPSGVSSQGLPFGVQFVGRPLDEASVLRGAAGLEQLVDFNRSIDV